MTGILWIYKLSVVLVLIQWQSMNAYAGLRGDPSSSPPTNTTNPGAGNCSNERVQSLSGYSCTCPTGFSPMQDEGVTCDLIAPGKQRQTIELSCTNTKVLNEVFTCGCRGNPGFGQREAVNITCKRDENLTVNHIICKGTQATTSSMSTSTQATTSSMSTSTQATTSSTSTSTQATTSSMSTSTQATTSSTSTSTQATTSSMSTSTQATASSTSTTEGPSPDVYLILLVVAVILVAVLLLTLIAFAIYRSRVRTRLRALAQAQSFDTEENMGHDNLACRQPRSLPDDELEMKVMVSPQFDAGFSKPRIYPGGHCQTLDNENFRPDNFHPDPLDSEGAAGNVSEIENELSAPNSPNCSDEPVVNLSRTSLPESIRKLETTFFSTGGEVFAQGCSNWEREPNESKRVSQSQAVNTLCFKDIFSRGRPRIKRATVFASRPDPKSDLIYLRFYVYSYNEDSRRCLELAEKERFPDSRPAREKPFRMYKANRVITVKFTHLEDGWKFVNTDDTQIYKYEKARSGCHFIDACDFAVKPDDGLDVNSFSCWVKFQQEDVDEAHWLYLNPGFTPLKRQTIRRSSQSNKGGQSNTTTSTARYEGSVHWDDYLSSLGSEPVTEEDIYQVSPDVGRNWKDLLRNLSIKEKTIENLSVDFMHEKITEQCIQGLINWKERDPQLATIKTLAIALHNVGCFDALLTLQKLR